jgi:4-diphosphocytidyl-2-C-methyl-D-erythritol kinase
MISYPNAKINLGLRILRKRADGFHDLETVFYPIRLADMLEIIPAGTRTFNYSQSGLKTGDPAKNLCVRAFRLFQQKFDIPDVRMHLHKVIPSGAGLGGGSSDAAFTLAMLNDIFKTLLGINQLEVMAAELGSDCAFFLENKVLLARGKGDKMEAVKLSLQGYYIFLVKPPQAMNTAKAYSLVQPSEEGFSVTQSIAKPPEKWRDELCNDFEEAIFKIIPALGNIKSELYRLGAVYAAMSGSGSCMYGIFKQLPVKAELNFKGCFTWQSPL